MLSLLTTAPARPAAATADAGTPAHRPDNDSGAGFAQALQRSSDAMNTPERGAPAAPAAERRAEPGNTREAAAAHGPDTPARPAAEGAHAGPDTGPEA
ncbi:MAG: hypothetical protein HY855_19560, partial [Burkholderiales bacterium]|nr:hypothetical protein [Burkholderiales bacterium]